MLKKITVDGFAIHDLSATHPPSWISTDGVDGLDDPQWRVSGEDNAGEDGGRISDILRGMRSFSLSGEVRGDDFATFQANRRAIRVACSIKFDAYRRPVPRKITFTTLDDVEYFISGHVMPYMPTRHNTTSKVLYQIRSDDPVLYVNDLVQLGPIQRPASSGLAFPWVFDPTIEFSAPAGGVMSFYNYGDAPSWPVVRFRGPAVNPTVVNQTMNRVMGLNATLAAGDVVEIVMREHTMVLNGTTPALALKTEESDWFSVQPGDNVIAFSTGDSGDTGTFELEYYPAVDGF